jgi:MerR family redox-sensitive transcriptional activator SoxR
VKGFAIGDVARRSGLPASTLRFYERVGLLPAPARLSKRRCYDASIFGRIRIVQIARSAGFSVEEIKKFVSGFPAGTRPSARWQALALRKARELDELIAGAKAMKAALESNFKCGCTTLDVCSDHLAGRIQKPKLRTVRVSADQGA